ncbi:hypothetical protein GCM10009599_05080 [Luteococcus peritonei]
MPASAAIARVVAAATPLRATTDKAAAISFWRRSASVILVIPPNLQVSLPTVCCARPSGQCFLVASRRPGAQVPRSGDIVVGQV